MMICHDSQCPALCQRTMSYASRARCAHEDHLCTCRAAEQLRGLVERIDAYRAVFEVPFDPGLREALKRKHAPLYDVIVRQEDASSLLDSALQPFREAK